MNITITNTFIALKDVHKYTREVKSRNEKAKSEKRTGNW